MSILSRLKTFGIECRRVFSVTKKPSKEEYQAIVKVSGIGILIIGLLGFIIQVAYQLLR